MEKCRKAERRKVDIKVFGGGGQSESGLFLVKVYYYYYIFIYIYIIIILRYNITYYISLIIPAFTASKCINVYFPPFLLSYFLTFWVKRMGV